MIAHEGGAARSPEALKDAHSKFRDAHNKHAKDLDILKELHAHHSSMAERMAYLEKVRLGRNLARASVSTHVLGKHWVLSISGPVVQ